MSTTRPSPRAPMLADLDALPPGVVGEIIEGVLYTMTKPRAPLECDFAARQERTNEIAML